MIWYRPLKSVTVGFSLFDHCVSRRICGKLFFKGIIIPPSFSQFIVNPSTSTTMIKTLIEEKTWPVLLYRRESDGWKKQESSSSPSTRNNRNHTIITSVAPRKDCIVFPTLRQRFSMKSVIDRGTVIRRGDKILLISKRRARALLLQFQSMEDCLAFSDYFVRLNPKPFLELSSRNEDMIHNDQSLHSFQQQNGETTLPIVGDEGHREVVSWIVKMLHDKCFLSYVHKIENHITQTEDGLQILQGLE